MNTLKPCPFCGRTPNPDWTDESYIECTNRKCSLYGYGMSTGDWNTRPIEDDLRKRIAELEALVNVSEGLYERIYEQAARIAELEAEIVQLTAHDATERQDDKWIPEVQDV